MGRTISIGEFSAAFDLPGTILGRPALDVGRIGGEFDRVDDEPGRPARFGLEAGRPARVGGEEPRASFVADAIASALGSAAAGVAGLGEAGWATGIQSLGALGVTLENLQAALTAGGPGTVAGLGALAEPQAMLGGAEAAGLGGALREVAVHLQNPRLDIQGELAQVQRLLGDQVREPIEPLDRLFRLLGEVVQDVESVKRHVMTDRLQG
jgi:hypothetical protein